jgi:hypothetical protein
MGGKRILRVWVNREMAGAKRLRLWVSRLRNVDYPRFLETKTCGEKYPFNIVFLAQPFFFSFFCALVVSWNTCSSDIKFFSKLADGDWYVLMFF